MILGAAEPDYVEMMAETVTAGDPTYTGLLAWVSLGLPVYHVRGRKDWVRPPQFDVPERVIEALATWDFWTQATFPDRLADLITDDVLDQFALAGTPEDCAERLLALQRELPEVTGLRIYAVPLAGKPLIEGYVDMVKGSGTVAALVNGATARAVPVSA